MGPKQQNASAHVLEPLSEKGSDVQWVGIPALKACSESRMSLNKHPKGTANREFVLFLKMTKSSAFFLRSQRPQHIRGQQGSRFIDKGRLDKEKTLLTFARVGKDEVVSWLKSLIRRNDKHSIDHQVMRRI